MTEFIKEEISLCKQVAEKHNKEIKYGDWFLNEGGFAKVWPYGHNCKRIDVIPLWTISDCLEFLREKACWARIDINEHYTTRIRVFDKNTLLSNWGMYPCHSGKTPLEACLKAVLAVLEEKK